MNKLRRAAQAVVDLYHSQKPSSLRLLGLGPNGGKLYVPECVVALHEALNKPKIKKFIKEKPMEVTINLLEDQIDQIVINQLENSIAIMEM